MYRRHLRFTPFKSFTTIRNVGMLVEQEIAREAPQRLITIGTTMKIGTRKKMVLKVRGCILYNLSLIHI